MIIRLRNHMLYRSNNVNIMSSKALSVDDPNAFQWLRNRIKGQRHETIFLLTLLTLPVFCRCQ
jgi:hypothetical protein